TWRLPNVRAHAPATPQEIHHRGHGAPQRRSSRVLCVTRCPLWFLNLRRTAARGRSCLREPHPPPDQNCCKARGRIPEADHQRPPDHPLRPEKPAVVDAGGVAEVPHLERATNDATLPVREPDQAASIRSVVRVVEQHEPRVKPPRSVYDANVKLVRQRQMMIVRVDTE